MVQAFLKEKYLLSMIYMNHDCIMSSLTYLETILFFLSEVKLKQTIFLFLYSSSGNSI